MFHKALSSILCCSLLVTLACKSDDDAPMGGTAGSGGSATAGTFGNPGIIGGTSGTTGTSGTSGSIDDDSGVVGVPCRERTLVEKVDLLFMVDNSNSMREEQAALQAQFPKLIRTLTTGERFPGDPDPFPAASDVHLAVVSSDMGLVGVTGIAGCSGFGDDGIMYDPELKPIPCEGGVPGQRFLTYEAGVTDVDELADNFGCLATLGTTGCGFEQQLESVLKALWPKTDVDFATGDVVEPNRVSFLKDVAGLGELGHGDVENKGFLRNDPEAPSLLGIVLVTDEEDCSSFRTSHFRPQQFLDPADPNYNISLNVRCHVNPDNLYPISRYSDGFKALRGGKEELVMFAAIAGVPLDLVDADAMKTVDFADTSSRNAFYDGILSDSRMQPMVVTDPMNPMEPQLNKIKTSCDTPTGVAYPPVRIVQLAKAMGEGSVVQSICQSDFGPAMDAIIDRLGVRLQDICLLE